MPILSLVYYRNLSLLSESCKAKALDIVAKCLRDPNSEVREIASAYVPPVCVSLASADQQDIERFPEMFSTTNGGRTQGEYHIFRHCISYKTDDQHRFTREIKETQLPKRRAAPGQVNPEYQAKMVELHGAILGATALVEAFPYTVPKFMRKLALSTADWSLIY